MTQNTLEQAGIPAGATPVGSLARDWNANVEFYDIGEDLYGNVTEYELESDAQSYKEIREQTP